MGRNTHYQDILAVSIKFHMQVYSKRVRPITILDEEEKKKKNTRNHLLLKILKEIYRNNRVFTSNKCIILNVNLRHNEKKKICF